MDILIKIKSFGLLGDICSQCAHPQKVLGLFENFEFYGWFVEGTDRTLLQKLLWEARTNEKISNIFPYIPKMRKPIPLAKLDVEGWYPIYQRALQGMPEKQLGWSRTGDLLFDLSEEQVDKLRVGDPLMFSVLVLGDYDQDCKWLNTVCVCRHALSPILKVNY